MRDFILALIVFGSLPFVLWRPAVGAYLWIWVSVMNPHALTWASQEARYAYFIAVATVVGLLFSKEGPLSKEPKRFPFTPVTVVLLLLIVWESITTLFAMAPAESIFRWREVMKMQLMVFVALYLLHSKQHVQVLMWVLAGSVAFYGVKGGVFTLQIEGEYRVFGPKGSMIEENNALALATIMTIPLLYYLFLQDIRSWVRWSLVASMVRWSLLAAIVLCGFSALGSHSRGALLAIAVMVGFLWWKSHSKAVTGLVLIILVPVAIGFMPDKWWDRMETIQEYEQDGSAMGRIHVWATATNLAQDRFLGGGFDMHHASEFTRYAPEEDRTLSRDGGYRAAHSIYFQMLGEHGFLGLALYVLLWILGWRNASWIIRHSRDRSILRWAFDLARMIQVSLVGFFVGGAFLSLAHWDVPYYLLVALVLTRALVERELKGLGKREGIPMVLETSAARRADPGVVSRSRLE